MAGQAQPGRRLHDLLKTEALEVEETHRIQFGHDMQTSRKNVRKYSILLAVAFAASYVYSVVDILPKGGGAYRHRCERYNEELNGGVVKEYQGRKFRIEMCGTGGDSIQSNDAIELQVFDEKGELAAMRHFVVNWNESKLERGVEYHPDHITYYDESLQYDYKKTISMPPTTLDWIRARIPLLD